MSEPVIGITPYQTVLIEEADIDDLVIMESCNCGDTLMVDFMVFEKVEPVKGCPKLWYWRRIR